jgi:hypothetical protein
MALSVDTLTWDCRSPEVVAGFWAGVLRYELVEIDDEDALIRDPKGRAGRSCSRSSPRASP